MLFLRFVFSPDLFVYLFLWNGKASGYRRFSSFPLFVSLFLCSSCTITLIISTVKRRVLISHIFHIFHIFQNILSGKWKITILWYISEYEIQRFGELRRRLGDITQSTLTKQLRELEQDGFISRYVYQEVPPKVEYSLTDLGKSFVPILQDMKKWSDIHLM